MAQTYSIAPGNIASIIDNSEIRSVDPEFDVLDLTPTPLPGWINRGKPVRLGEDLLYEKVVDRRLPRTVTNTANIVTAATDITLSTSDAARLQIGHLLHVDSEVMRVITVASDTTVGVTKGFAGTTSTTHTTSSTIRVMSPVFADGATFQQSATSQGEFKTFLPFVIMYQDAVTPIRTATRTYLEGNKDPREFRKDRIRHEKMAELEQLLLHSRSSTISATVAGAPAGIRQLISTNSTAVSGVLTATHIEDMLDDLYAWDGRHKITVIGNRNMHRVWSAVWRQYFEKQGTPVSTPKIGFAVTVYESPTMGEVEFMVCDSCLDSELLFLRKESWELNPLDWAYGSGWHEFERGVKETNALGFTWGMYAAFVFTVDDERRNGILTGITSTGSSYAGFV